ncbi:MAG: hypothetical protein AAFV53_01795 [Myxococcota bacterium]
MSRDGSQTATETYGDQVTDTISANPREAEYRPDSPLLLRIMNCRRPRNIDDLSSEEQRQLQAIFKDEYPAILENEECEVEAAEVVNESGVVRFRLYGWNYGMGFLMPPSGLDVVAFAAQHDMEHWRLEQRPIFFAMDDALRADGHTFQQALFFCWADDARWEGLEGLEPGTVGSEPYLLHSLRESPHPDRH